MTVEYGLEMHAWPTPKPFREEYRIIPLDPRTGEPMAPKWGEEYRAYGFMVSDALLVSLGLEPCPGNRGWSEIDVTYYWEGDSLRRRTEKWDAASSATVRTPVINGNPPTHMMVRMVRMCQEDWLRLFKEDRV